MPEIKPNKTLDVRGLFCPEPVLKTKKAMDAMQVGEVLEVICTDPGSEIKAAIKEEERAHEY